MSAIAATLDALNLTQDEYDLICRMLSREPNGLELQIFSVMWSEHCSYKSSRVHLRRLPTRGPRVLLGPGENAGIVDIGEGWAAVFKVESHNHPSFIEPYQGAATGVGGIIRDIFTMGARPIGLLDSLRFGELSEPRNRSLLRGVVSGIAGYGNCIGIPTVGGEVQFAPCYDLNPLVNVLCVGILRHNEITYGKAHGPGNPVIYVGARTGRDGIHGATMASAEFGEDAQAKRPNVQVGDPFMEKLLLEACIEVRKAGLIVGIQDMGAAGLTCSSTEMGARAGTGIDLDLDRVPLREEGMTPEEIMLSESQERMLLVTQQGREEEVAKVFRKWGLESAVVGAVLAESLLRVRWRGKVVAEIPNGCLTDNAPVYRRPVKLPDPPDESIPPLPTLDPTAALTGLLQRLSIANKRWVYEQYDHMVRTNTLVLPGGDAAVLRVKGTTKGIALSTDGNGWYCSAYPRRGAQHAVAEAARNVACTGAQPIAATNCLNFGNPEKAEIMGQFAEAVDGMAEACAALDVPITGGNVSFYNETLGKGIHPTPVVGVLGLIEDTATLVTHHFKHAGDIVYLAGNGEPSLGASEYLRMTLGRNAGVPAPIDLAAERAVQELCIQAARQGLLASAHDCSDGGLAVALAECSFPSRLGVSVDLDRTARAGMTFEVGAFGESAARVVVSARPEDAEKIEKLAVTLGCPLVAVGTVLADRVQLRWRGGAVVDQSIEELRAAWARAFEERLAL